MAASPYICRNRVNCTKGCIYNSQMILKVAQGHNKLLSSIGHLSLFTARRLAKRGICRRRVSVCVCVSVTLWYCIKTAKRRITQTTRHDRLMTLVF